MNISVIIPTHNRENVIARALQSVEQQSLKPIDVIVVDDGSTDNTEKLINQRFPHVNYIHQKHKGVSAARNLGISQAKGDWLAFLDSDDEWMANKLEKQMLALTKESEFKFCHTNEIWIKDGKHINPMRKHEKTGGYIFQKCLPLCVISPSTAILHRSVFDKAGLFDESMPACEDYDLWLRICAKQAVLYLDEKLIKKYGGHDDQLSSRYWGMDRFRIHALEKMLKFKGLEPQDKEATLYMLIKKVGIVLNGAKKRNNQDLVSFYTIKKRYYINQLERLLAQQTPLSLS